MNMTSQIIGADLGDPVTALHLYPLADAAFLVIAGTALGKVWLYDSLSHGRLQLAGHSEDAIRGVFCDGSHVYAAVGDVICRKWRITIDNSAPDASLLMTPSYRGVTVALEPPATFRIERRGSALLKYLVQRESEMVCVYPGMTTFFDILTTEQSMAPYRLLTSEQNVVNSVPLDFYGRRIIFGETLEDRDALQFRVVDLEEGRVVAMGTVDGTNTPPSLADVSPLKLFADSSARVDVQHVKFFDQGSRVLMVLWVSGRSVLAAFDSVSGELLERFSGGGVGRILDVDVMEDDASCLFEDGSIYKWNLFEGGGPKSKGLVDKKIFKLDQKYLLRQRKNSAAVAGDKGVWLALMLDIHQ